MSDNLRVPSRDDSPPGAGRRAVVQALIERGAVAVLRLDSVASARDAVSALADGGVSAIEVTLTTPGAFDLIEMLSAQEGLLVGAGSVLTTDQLRLAVNAGARYVVSPVFDADVVAAAHAHEVPVMPGAFTPTEMLRAHQAGADLIKVFPADSLGPAYLKGILAPMPFLRLMPTGGVTPENVGRWLTAGAVAVGLGSSLVDAKTVANRDWSVLAARARTVVAQIVESRAAKEARA